MAPSLKSASINYELATNRLIKHILKMIIMLGPHTMVTKIIKPSSIGWIDFRTRIEEISGENLSLCFQCGACSSGCPTTQEMDYLPSKIIRMVQLGLDEVLETKTIWVCTTCFECEARCPRGLDIANVMEALRILLLRKKFDKINLDEVPPEELRELPPVAMVSTMRKLAG